MTENAPKYLLLGSCFAQNMGERLLAQGFRALVNPLGTLYNPESIYAIVSAGVKAGGALGRTVENSLFFDSAMQEWRSWLANTKFRNKDKAALSAEISHTLDTLHGWMLETDECVITLGTNVCYALCESGMVVTNCQRQPDRLFTEYRMKLGECVQALDRTLQLLWTANARMKVTLTVSPYRYKKYGLHGNQLSKAVLLLAEEEMVRRYRPLVRYFPSYEIMVDELRDYSYYAGDGLHPSDEAVEIIWRRFNEDK